jgi:hypothetical protein
MPNRFFSMWAEASAGLDLLVTFLSREIDKKAKQIK